MKPFALSASVFSDDVKADIEPEADTKIWNLLKNIASLGVSVKTYNVKFHPLMVWEGKRTFSIEEITDDGFRLLEEIDLKKLPLNLRERVADILWIAKKDYAASIAAAVSYFQLFKSWFSKEKGTGTLDSIKRAICISAQIKDGCTK